MCPVSPDMTQWWQILFQPGCRAEYHQPQQAKQKLYPWVSQAMARNTCFYPTVGLILKGHVHQKTHQVYDFIGEDDLPRTALRTAEHIRMMVAMAGTQGKKQRRLWVKSDPQEWVIVWLWKDMYYSNRENSMLYSNSLQMKEIHHKKNNFIHDTTDPGTVNTI